MKIKNLDYIRGLSILGVLLYHFDSIAQFGFLGVDIFFVLSGYLVTRSCAGIEGSASRLLKIFLLKRARRILPIFLTFIAFNFLAALLLISPNVGAQQESLKTGWSALFFLSNFYLEFQQTEYFAPNSNHNVFLHTWSLSTEIQCYLLLLTALMLLRSAVLRKKRKNRVQEIGIITILILCLVYFVEIFTEITAYWSPTIRFTQVWVGAVIALLHSENATRGQESNDKFRSKNSKIGLACTTAIGLLFFFGNTSDIFWNHLVITVVTATFIYFNSGTGLLPMKKTLCQLGDRAYVLYLFHYPIYIYLKLALLVENLSDVQLVFLAFLTTFLISEVLYRIIEIRCKGISLKGAIAQAFFAFIICGVVSILIRPPFPPKEFLSSNYLLQTNCLDGRSLFLSDNSGCSFGTAKKNKPKTIVIGDSLALTNSLGAINVITELSRGTITVSSKLGCSVYKTEETNDLCSLWRRQSLSYLSNSAFTHIVIMNSFTKQIDPKKFFDYVAQLKASDKRIMVVLSPPFSDYIAENNAILRFGVPSTRHAARPDHSRLFSEFKKMELEGVYLWDMSEVFCRHRGRAPIDQVEQQTLDRKCLIAKDGVEYFTYGDHLSVIGNEFYNLDLKRKLTDSNFYGE